MTRSSTITAMLAASVVCAISVFAQPSQRLQGKAASAPAASPRAFPAPVNLKVLPGNLTGQQIHDIMDRWTRELGVRCNACHAQDSESVIYSGTSRSTFADDSKPMKEVARLMYTMTDEINVNFVAKVEGSGMPVTCGTCHRGRINPEPFASPSEPEAHHADAPLSPELRPPQ